MTVVNTKVVQVSNIAPQVTKDQMHVFFSFLGKIEDIRLYPTVRDASFAVHSRICYIKFVDASTVAVAQHMTNAVFIDRALIVIPMSNDEIPDECYVLEMTQHGAIVPGLPLKDPKLPPHLVNSVCGSGKDRMIFTADTNLDTNGLPPYPPLPANFDAAKIEETRRTVLMLNCDAEYTTDEVIEFFSSAGEVKYLRTCKRNSDESTNMLVEFTDHSSIVNALKMNGMQFKGKAVEIQHATQPITKPQVNSNEAAQQEIEEAACRFREDQCMMDATKKPVAGIAAKNERRSRSRSSGRRKRSRSGSRSRKRSTSRKRRSSSRKRDRSRSRSRRRSRSPKRRSLSRKRDRSRSRSRTRRRRSASRRSEDRSRRSASTSRYRRSPSRSSNLHRNRRKSKERSSKIQSRDKARDRSKDGKRSGDESKTTRRREASKDKERKKDENGSNKVKRDKGEITNKSSGDVTAEKKVSRSRSRTRSKDRKKRDRKRSRSGGDRRRTPSPHISRKRKSRSRSRSRGRRREAKSVRRD